jgi:hypothetical protein
LINCPLTGKKFLQIAAYAEKSILHVIAGALQVSWNSSRVCSGFRRPRSGRRIDREPRITGMFIIAE